MWTDTELVQKHLEQSARFVSDKHRDFERAWAPRTDSPLETIFGIWWRAAAMAGEINGDVYCVPQVEVSVGEKTYRIDFVVHPDPTLEYRARLVGIAPKKIGVELDGHDFHERTREQVDYRNRRDRDLASDGWLVLHFSGSELNRDPLGCIKAVWAAGEQALGWELECAVMTAEDAMHVAEVAP